MGDGLVPGDQREELELGRDMNDLSQTTWPGPEDSHSASGGPVGQLTPTQSPQGQQKRRQGLEGKGAGKGGFDGRQSVLGVPLLHP